MEKEHLQILLEDMNRKFDLVLEGHAALDRKIDDRFHELKAEIKENSFAIGVLNNKIDDVEVHLNNKIDDVEVRLNNKIDHVEVRLNNKIDDVEERLGKRIDDVEERLGKRIDDVEERLGKRIDDVEDNLGKKIDSVAADLSAHRADTEAHHGVYRVKETEEQYPK